LAWITTRDIHIMVVQDQQGKVLRSGQVMNGLDCVRSFLQPFSTQETHAVVEATRNWTVMYDWLEAICDDVVLANPLKVKAIAEAKIKTDKIEATILAHLLRADLMPIAHVPGKYARELRLALRERIYFVRLRTMVKNRIHTIFDCYPEEVKKLKLKTDLFGKAGREQLKTMSLSDIDRMVVDRKCEFIDDLNKYIKASEGTIKALVKGHADMKRLMSIPGVGQFTAWLLIAELDGITRFGNAKKLAAYAGLVPSTYSSGGKTFHGSIIKGGNKYIRWAMIEAIIPAIRTDEELREDYERIKAKKGYNKAKVAVARKLLTIVYHVLKEKRNYKKKNKLERDLKSIQRLT
jgi:transposase